MGLPTGFKFLDGIYAQYIPGHIWVMGAYTSVGKTAMMVQKICNLIKTGTCPHIVVVSTEMTEAQLTARVLANLTGVHSQRILSGNYRNAEEADSVAKQMAMLRTVPLKIYDDIYTLGDIENTFRKADLHGGVEVGFVDYIQNCRVPKASSEYEAGTILAKGLQKLAKDVSCTLICLSQVSNDVGRGNTDQLEFKGSGAWAAVADVGIYLHRRKDDKYALLYDIKKNRHGQLYSQRFEYKMDFTRLEPVATVE